MMRRRHCLKTEIEQGNINDRCKELPKGEWDAVIYGRQVNIDLQ